MDPQNQKGWPGQSCWTEQCTKEAAAVHEAFQEELKAHIGKEEFLNILIGFLFQRLGNLMAVTLLQADQILTLQQLVALSKPFTKEKDIR